MKPLCVCASLPRIRSSAELIVYQHFSELNRQSNTGRLVERMVEPSRILQWGSADEPIPAESFDREDTRYLVLYPRSTTRRLEPDDHGRDGKRTALILLDGTWNQARSMSRRIPTLQALDFVALPDGDEPRWKLRRSPGSGRCCTLEAAFRAVCVLDGEERARPLMAAQELVMTRGLHQRGKMRRDEMEAACEPLFAALLGTTSPGA